MVVVIAVLVFELIGAIVQACERTEVASKYVIKDGTNAIVWRKELVQGVGANASLIASRNNTVQVNAELFGTKTKDEEFYILFTVEAKS